LADHGAKRRCLKKKGLLFLVLFLRFLLVDLPI
jgi:hypothetical protein